MHFYDARNTNVTTVSLKELISLIKKKKEKKKKFTYNVITFVEHSLTHW